VKSIHKSLRLSHHKHTGKIIHHQHTSYGVLVLLMLVPIFVLSMVGYRVFADDNVQVTAVVPQVPPPFPPTITFPTNGGRTPTGPVVVTGGCPLADPAVYISIYEGTRVVGTTMCSNATGKYSLPIDFDYGDHTIYAQVVTFTNDLGLASSPITFNRYFTVTTGGGSSGGSNPIDSAKIQLSNPLLFISGQGVVPFGPQLDAVWRGTISGGTAPYKVHVTWGDGRSNDYTIYDQNQQEFRHHFDSLGSYTMIFKVTDSNGTSISLRVIAASALPIAAPLTADSQQSLAWYQRFIQTDIVKAYGFVFFFLICVWFFKRRHDRREDNRHGPQTPRRPYRSAHI
jgi:hypothetical protein